MGGMDREDDYCSSYRFLKKSLKWWRTSYFWILEVSLVNSFQLYNMNQQSANLPTLSRVSQKRGRPSSIDVEDWMVDCTCFSRMKGLFSLVQQKSKRRQEVNILLWRMSKEARTAFKQVFCHISYSIQTGVLPYIVQWRSAIRVQLIEIFYRR
jgi:hypothetical protein